MKQRGFLLISLAVLIVIVALLVATASHFYIASITSANNQRQSSQAFYLAETGWRRALYQLLDPVLANRASCANLATSGNLTTGSYTATTSSTHYLASNITLASAITATDSSIPLSTTTGLADFGRVRVNREIIDYDGINGNNLVRVKRGSGGSIAASHTSGSPLAQWQCVLQSIGQAPTNTPITLREISVAAQQQEAIAVADRAFLWFNYQRFNQPLANQWDSIFLFAFFSARTLNAVSLLSNADGWAVGDATNNSPTVLRWSAARQNFSVFNTGLSTSADLHGVSAVSGQDVWAVGERDSGYTILHFDGSNWCQLSTPGPSCGGISISTSVPNGQRDLSAIHVIDTTQNGQGNFGFAVGGTNSSGRTLLFNGSSWSDRSVPNNVDILHGVYVIASNSAYAVGDGQSNSGRIIHWNGSNWTVVSSPANPMYAIDMYPVGSSYIGWAVGENAQVYFFNGTSWVNAGTIPGGGDYRGVAIMAADDAWAVGDGGRRAHYDGNSWTLFASGGQDLNAVDALPAKLNDNAKPYAGWQEVFS